MRILFFDWKSYGKEHVVKALEEFGYEVDRVRFDHQKDNDDNSYVKKAEELLSYKLYDMVLSLNYFSAIAKACHENRIVYISWLYDSPLLQVWDTTAYYPECYIFSFDQKQCDGLKKEGINKVYYMPLAVETDWLDDITPTDDQKEYFKGDVAFVGNLYDKKTPLQNEIIRANPEILRGYSDAIIEAQMQLLGVNFLEDVLEPEDIKNLINRMMFKLPEQGLIAPMTMVYANYYLGAEVTLRERKRMIQMVSENFNLNVYTNSDISSFKKANNKGGVDYYKEMPLVFRQSKINLNLTLRSIQTGIPLRCWDILGSGGFLLTNYQADMSKHFEAGVDYDYYINEEDMLSKIEYYLTHDDERNKIAQSGYQKVKKLHSYKIRLKEMLKIVEEEEKRR